MGTQTLSISCGAYLMAITLLKRALCEPMTSVKSVSLAGNCRQWIFHAGRLCGRPRNYRRLLCISRPRPSGRSFVLSLTMRKHERIGFGRKRWHKPVEKNCGR